MGKMNRKVYYILILLCVLMILSTQRANAQSYAGNVDTVLYAMTEPGATVTETTLGDALADVVRERTYADVVILPGGDFKANLQGGPVTEADVRAVYRADSTLALAWISPSTLCTILEKGVSASRLSDTEKLDIEASRFGGFPQISGFSFSYDVSFSVGERVTEIILDTGQELELFDSATSILLCTTVDMLSGGYGMPRVEIDTVLDLTPQEALLQWLEGHDVLKSPETGRIQVKGTVDSLTDGIPHTMIYIIVAFLTVGSLSSRKLRESLRFSRVDGPSSSSCDK